MPLINFRTNLTSLKYGDPTTGDRPGGGYSGQPYIQFPIESADTQDPYKEYYSTNRNNLDFPIRGGAISELLDATISGRLDKQRIQKFFNDAPRGTTFIQKQIGLQLTNPRTQVPQALTFAGDVIGNAVLPVTQTYNPLNTLAQVAVQGSGIHFNRHGVSPAIYESERQTYAYYADNPDNNQGNTNRLAILRALKLIGDTGFTLNRNTSTTLGIDPDLVDRMGISVIQNQLFNYPGGPGSVYGIGFTKIRRDVNTQPETDTRTGVSYSTLAMKYQQLANQKTTDGVDVRYPRPQDYRAQLADPFLPTWDYQSSSLETRLGIGNPGGQQLSLFGYSDYRTSKTGSQDQINLLNPFRYDTSKDTPWSSKDANGTKDIIKFTFEAIDNDYSNRAVALIFRAFLEGTITDNNSAQFNSFKYLGRGETFRTYQGFTRAIGFSFKVAAQTRDEMKPLYTKLNHLMSLVYPDYSPYSNLMRGTVVRMTIGDYIYRMPGYLEDVNITIDNSNTPWDIVLGDTKETDMRQLPHHVTVSSTFYPIMDILPRAVTFLNPQVPLIVNTDKPFTETTIKGETSQLFGATANTTPF